VLELTQKDGCPVDSNVVGAVQGSGAGTVSHSHRDKQCGSVADHRRHSGAN